MQDFKGKTAVVTGGASGIGRALADRFAAVQMNVVLADIEQDALDRAVTGMEERQQSVHGIVTNTMRKDSVQALLEGATQRFGNVHILCNNAGIGTATPVKGIWEIPDSDWEWTMGVNLYGVLYGIQTFVPHMLEHGEPSHVVNTASLAGLMTGSGPYGVSKHGVVAMTESLKRDLLNNAANISASVLCPGFVNTNIYASERNRPTELQNERPENADAVNAMQNMLKGFLEKGKEPADIAEAVFRAIEQDHLYVLPHPAWDDVLRARFDAILARGNLPETNLEQVAARQQAGEQL